MSVIKNLLATYACENACSAKSLSLKMKFSLTQVSYTSNTDQWALFAWRQSYILINYSCQNSITFSIKCTNETLDPNTPCLVYKSMWQYSNVKIFRTNFFVLSLTDAKVMWLLFSYQVLVMWSSFDGGRWIGPAFSVPQYIIDIQSIQALCIYIFYSKNSFTSLSFLLNFWSIEKFIQNNWWKHTSDTPS